MNRLPVEPAWRLSQQPLEQRWLIDSLWSEQAVGLIGGEPKSFKSYLALELAVAVSSGTPCLRHFPVPRAGRVLLYAAEDALHVVRQRLDGISAAAGVALRALDIQVITAPRLRLDLADDVVRLTNTVAALRPRLLVLDPFVRLHRCDENASGEVAPLLALLRELQRTYRLAVTLVHHAKKGGAKVRAGQALRGSSEFHAWGDSMLYLRRHGERVTLAVEHRAASGIAPLDLQLAGDPVSLALRIADTPAEDETPSADATLPERVLEVLAAAHGPLGLGQLRTACHVRKATLCDVLSDLTGQGRIQRNGRGYVLAATAQSPGSGSRSP